MAESWADRRPGWFKRPASLVTGGGYADMGDVAANLDKTLAALKQLAERRVTRTLALQDAQVRAEPVDV